MSASSSSSTADAPASDPSGQPSETAPSITLGAVREPQRLHPLTLLLRVGASLPALVIILFPTLQNPSSENVISVVLGLLYGLVALPAIILQYLRFSYRISQKQIVIQKGVFNRKNRSIPLERVQNIQVERNLVARLLGVARIKIVTAGSSSTEGTLEYVGLEEAHKIRRVVRSFQEDTTEEADSSEEEIAADDTLYSMSLADVLRSGAFRFSLVYLAVIFSVLELVDPETLIQGVLQSEGTVERVTDVMTSHPAFAILASILIAIFLGWITGIVVHLSRYYRFRLWLDDDKLRMRHGLFHLKEGTIPLKKVQALILRANPLMRAFGWYGLEVQTIGGNVAEEGHRMIAPFAQYDDLLALGQRIRSYDVPDDFRSVSMLTIRRMFFRYTAVLSVVVVPAAYFWPAQWGEVAGLKLPWWGFAVVPLILVWVILHYGNHGYQATEDGLYIRRGVLTHHLWILPLEKFHVFVTRATIFQRRLNLKTLYVDTAGAATFAYPEVVDLPADEADEQAKRLSDRFKALYRHRIEEATGAPDTRLSPNERPRLPLEKTDRRQKNENEPMSDVSSRETEV